MDSYRVRTIKYSVLQAAYWMLAAVGLAFVTPLLENKGFSSAEIGWLNAVKYLSVIFFQIGIASFSDRHARTFPLKWIMEIMGVAGIITTFAFWLMDNDFVEAVVVFILYGATVSCLSPIVDSLSVQYMNQGQDLNYTLSRACGSGAWALSCVGIGIFSDKFGINNILLLQIAATILFLVTCLVLEPVRFANGTEPDKKNFKKLPDNNETKVHSSWYLLWNYPKYTLFLLGCMVIFMGYNLNATFMVDIIEKLGGNHIDLGIGEFVLAVSEMPVALFFVKMRKKFSLDEMMIICALFCTLRAAATTFAPTVALLILSQAFEILGLSIYYAGSVYFVMENLPEADVVKGVSFITVASVGAGQTIASACCGIIKEAFGLHNLLLISILVSFLAILIMLAMKAAPKQRKSKAVKKG